MKSARDYGHFYGDAFMRMKYRCEGCGKWEWIWNSRDGVTPFLVPSRCCSDQEPDPTWITGPPPGAERPLRHRRVLAQHVLWQDDEYLPEYQPQPGERVFTGPPDSPSVVEQAR